MRAEWRVNIQICVLFTSTLFGGKLSVSRLGSLIPEEKDFSTNWIESWVDPRNSLDDVEKRIFFNVLRLELRPYSCPARS
jgi:hypothetical protein